jgi:hypothetical protein
MPLRRPITADAFERFLRDHDAAALLAAAGPEREEPPGQAEFPEAHRLCDVVVEGKGWRVARVVDALAGGSRLFVEETDVPMPKPGVPYSLQGNALLEWVRAEMESPSDEPAPGGSE